MNMADVVSINYDVGQGYACIRLNQLLIVRCYCRTNISLMDYSRFFDGIKRSIYMVIRLSC